MSRILAIDYGRKRCGIAVSDPLGIIASPLKTVETDGLIYFLKVYFSENDVSEVIIGNPLRLDGTENELVSKIDKLIRNFGKVFADIPIQKIDERYTSSMALQAMIDGGTTKAERREKGNIDKVSAAILLQGYMAR